MNFVERTIGEIDVDYAPLPVGYTDADGKLHKYVSLREINGEVEEAISDSKLRDNIAKIITELIKGIIVEVAGLQKVNAEIVREFYVVDRDYLLVLNYKNSFKDEVHWKESCPACRQTNDVEININNVKVRFLEENESRSFTFQLPRGIKDENGILQKEIELVLPNGRVQERMAPIVRINPAQATTAMMSLITKRIGTISPVPHERFKEMTSKDRQAIGRFLSSLKLGVDMEVRYFCSSCNTEQTTTIPLTALMGE